MDEKRNKLGQTLEEFLLAYNPDLYKHPSVTVDMVVFTLISRGDRVFPAVLLIRRGDHPSIGMHALPGGFVEIDEDIDTAAARELLEETGIDGLSFCQFGAFGKVNRDPRTRIITISYLACAPMDTLKPRAGDDAAAAALYEICAEKSDDTLYLSLRGANGEEMSFNTTVRDTPLKFIADPIENSPLASDHGELLIHAMHNLFSRKVDTLKQLFLAETPAQIRELERLNRLF